MKQLTICCLLLLSIIGARAENVISLSSVSGHPGDEVTVEVGLTMTDAVTAAEIIIPLDKQLTYVAGSATLNSARADGHELSAAVVDGSLRLYVYSLSLSILKGSEGNLATFKLKLKKEPADYQLTPQVMMSNAAGTSITASVETGTVTLLSPKLTVVTTSIDYGHIPIRSTYTQYLTLQNSGNEPLQIADVTCSAGAFIPSETEFTIAAGEQKQLEIVYKPTVRGAVEETVIFESNAVNGEQKAVLVADPFSVNELHVEGASGTSDSEVEIALRVNNMEPLVGMQCTFALPEALEYVEGSFAVTERSSSHTATASFANGRLTFFLYSSSNATFTGDDGVIGTFKVKLDGNSGWYPLEPEGVVLSNITVENMTSATEGAGVTIQSPSLYGEELLQMGSTPVTTPVTATYMLTNNGDAPLTLSKVAFLAEGYEVKTSLPLTVEPWQNAPLEVVYTPTVEGEFTTTMNLYTNDPANRMKAVKVEVAAYEPNNLTLSGECVEDGNYRLTVGMDNYTDIVAVQMDIHWMEGMTTSLDALEATTRLQGHGCSVADMGNGVYRVILYSMSNTPIAGNEGTLFTLDYTPKTDVACDGTTVEIKNVILSNAGGVDYSSAEGPALEVEYYLSGDVNGDGRFSIVDITMITNSIQRKENVGFVSGAADLNADGRISIVDATITTNLVLKK